jgi:nucleotide-binding universal stress UspA family protein
VFTNIMIATDGSDLAAKAVKQGVLFAKEIAAKITAVTITEPFHFSRFPPTNSNIPRSNTRNTPRLTAKSAWQRFGLSGDYRSRRGEKGRSDRDGFTRASRCLGSCPW